ncbi:MAG: hypothetical protein K8S22_15945 [Betaproteobacteria bacterium]|nr:hypothetical protein [Betaproteobacteria bacterium]
MKIDIAKTLMGLAAAALLLLSGASHAQPRWGAESSPSPSTSTSQRANEAADRAVYKPIEYPNASKAGPPLIVIPGEIKSNNATFTQKFGANNIADFAEIELSKANFPVLERTNLGPLLNEFTLAYNLGDQGEAQKMLGRGKLKTTKWVVKFDILKTEQVAAAQKGFDGRAIGNIIGIFGGTGAAVGGTAVGSVKTQDSSGVWIIGMRYKIMNAETTEQVATGYTEEKMEVGATSTSVLGASSGQQGGVTLDTMVQRLIQKTVWEIDSKYK